MGRIRTVVGRSRLGRTLLVPAVHRWRRRRLLAAVDVPAELTSGSFCFVDRGVDPEVAGTLLEAVHPSRVVAAGSVPRASKRPWPVTPLQVLVGRGGARDERLAQRAHDGAQALVAQLLRHLDDEVAWVDDVPVAEELRYELQGRLLAHLRVLDACADLPDPARDGAVLFLEGDGDLGRLLAPRAADRFGAERVFTAAASPGLRPEDRAFRPLSQARSTAAAQAARSSPAAADVAGGPAQHESQQADGRPQHAATGPGRPLVLAWPLRNHTRALAPVVRRLAQTGPVTVLALSAAERDAPHYDAYEDLRREGLPVTVDFGLARAAEDPAASEAARQPRCQAVASDVATRVAAAAGPGLQDLIEAVRLEVQRAVGEVLPRMRRFAIELDHRLADIAPGAVLISRERGWENRLGARVADAHGIPTVLVQGSLLSYSARHAPVPTGYVTVFDEYARDLHVSHLGAAPDKVAITGFPSFDPIVLAPQSPPAARGAHPVVLLAMQRNPLADDAQLIDAVASAAAHADASAHLVVKAHPKAPRGHRQRYEDVLARTDAAITCEVVAEGDVRQLLEKADLVVSGWSTTLVEAALMGRPALAVSLSGDPLPLPLDEMGVAHAVRSRAELDEALPQLLADTELRRLVEQRQRAYLDANPHLASPPTAAERIAAVVEGLLDGPAPPG